jgi:hypothetical protein
VSDLPTDRPLEHDDLAEGVGVFATIMLQGTFELAPQIDHPSLDAARGVIPCDLPVARTCFLKACLLELQRCGLAMLRWKPFLEELRAKTRSQLNNAATLQLHSILYEQSIWQRKLAEALAALICFRNSNEIQYYFHYLLCLALERALRESQEQKDFFGSVSLTGQETQQVLFDRLRAVENASDFSIEKCWYLREKTPLGSRGFSAVRHQVTQSARQQILLALQHSTRAEKSALGYCYEHAFARSSERIHFSALAPEVPYDYGQLRFACSQVGLLGARVLRWCHDLAGLSALGATLASIAKSELETAAHPFAERFEPGDFAVVFLQGRVFLAEIVDSRLMALGNESYRVRFLGDLPFGKISEDWVRPDLLQFLYKKRDLLDAVGQTLERDGPPGGLGLSEAQIEECVRKGALEVWTRGLRPYAERCLEAKRTRPFDVREPPPNVLPRTDRNSRG